MIHWHTLHNEINHYLVHSSWPFSLSHSNSFILSFVSDQISLKLTISCFRVDIFGPFVGDPVVVCRDDAGLCFLDELLDLVRIGYLNKFMMQILYYQIHNFLKEKSKLTILKFAKSFKMFMFILNACFSMYSLNSAFSSLVEEKKHSKFQSYCFVVPEFGPRLCDDIFPLPLCQSWVLGFPIPS